MRRKRVSMGCVPGIIVGAQSESWWKAHIDPLFPSGCVEVKVNGKLYTGIPEPEYKGPRYDGQLTAEGSDGVRYVLVPKEHSAAYAAPT